MEKKELLKKLNEETKLFRHIVSSRVKFAEVDSFGVTHNIQYLYWLEWARVEYLQNLGVKLTSETFLTELPLMVVHTRIDYFSPCTFNDEYEVLSRTALMKKSSIRFDNIIRLKNGPLLTKASAVLVHLNPKTKRPADIPDFFKEKVLSFEKDNVKIL